MKLKTSIFLLFATFIAPKVWSTELPEHASYFPDDTVTVQTVLPDSVTLYQFKKDLFYDYNATPSTEDSLWNMLLERIARFLSEQFSMEWTAGQLKTILWIVFAVVLLALMALIFIYKPSLFFRNKKQQLSFAVEDEDIHELDFTSLIQNALQKEQFADAIRWEYLRLLKVLDGKEWISWNHHKTVNDYVNEMKESVVKTDFKEVSRQFLYYRYGNFDAFSEDWDAFSALTDQITKRI